jgi:DNA-directed RNA polymerase specialized sigma24 family protein
VKDSAILKVEAKKNWTLNQGAFQRLLDWLDEGSDSAGEKYLEMRRRLVAYFDRKNSLAPDEMADETLNRVARRLEEEGDITDTPVARYCYIVAKFVFLESLRHADREPKGLDELTVSAQPSVHPTVLVELEEERALNDKMLACLEACLQKLESDNRELLLQYYQGEQRVKIDNRRALAERLGLTMNALGIRACRIRARLAACVSKCAGR